VLDLDVGTLDSSLALTSTIAVQLGTLIAGVAVTRALAREGVRADAVAGLSVGAFAAAVACGALAFADALSLVQLRGEYMHRAYPHGYGMAAIMGLTERQVADVVEQLGGAGAQIYIANVAAPTQIVVSGAERTLDAVLESARQAGARQGTRMAVSIPSHCPLLDPVAQRLARALLPIELHAPRLPYVSSCRARVVYDAQGVREDLIRNVATIVRWHDSMTALYELGIRLFIEPPPGQVLSRLAQQAFPEARAAPVDGALLPSIVLLAQREAHRAA